jgi:signal transduction histidine kinase
MSKVAKEVNADPNSEARIKPLNRDDELAELASSINQMLDRMQSYIEQQKQFVGDVSHELRTPVAVIEGHLNMLERWGKDDPQILDESIKASLQEADRMKHLIQEMLDLTRAEQIDVQYPYEITNVNEVVRRVVSDLAMVHPDFKIQLDEDDLPDDTEIQMYHGHLEQLLVILIDNGIKYSTDRKQINVSAGVTKKEVSIMVQDFGEGISPEDQKKIFNRFYRVDKARTREKGGNGLGLSIAQKLVDSYKGEISVESVEGQGSQFKMVFPVLSKKRAAELRKIEAEKHKNDVPDGILK